MRKHGYKFVKECFELEGYQLLSTEYKREELKLSFVCPFNHIGSIRFSDWKKKSRCRQCGIKKNGLSHRVSFTKIQINMLKFDYQLLKIEYKSPTIYHFVCPQNHIHFINAGNWLAGNRCGKCYELKFQNEMYFHPNYQIKASINRQLKRDNSLLTWQELYDENFLAEIGRSVQSVYESRIQSTHVDHIVPCSWFDLTDKNQLLSCWHPDNLQVIGALENVSKGNRHTQESFRDLCDTHKNQIKLASRIPLKLQACLDYWIEMGWVTL